jgi:hypothetical protein
MRRIFFSIFLLLVSIGNGFGVQTHDWLVADLEVKRLSPDIFVELPQKVISDLNSRGCTIPQAYNDPKPHNVIKGEFAKKGQIDWAVLCSKDRVSSILIFWGGSPKNVSDVETTKDQDWLWLQGVSEDKIGYSRVIREASKDEIRYAYRPNAFDAPNVNDPKPKLQSINHGGIRDDSIYRGSSIYYYYKGKWWMLVQEFMN